MEEVRQQHHSTLKPANIRVLMSRDWQKKHGEKLAATAKPANTLVRCIYGAHGFITVSRPYWDQVWANADTGEERKAAEKRLLMLFDHELCHFAWADGKLKLVDAPHLFVAEVKHWGAQALNPNPLVKAIRDDLQLTLDGMHDEEDAEEAG